VRHRCDARRVDGGQLVDQAEDRRELRAHFLRVRGIDLEAREMRDAVDVGKREIHGVGRERGEVSGAGDRGSDGVCKSDRRRVRNTGFPHKISAGALHNRLS
jgi:hypothetical protein